MNSKRKGSAGERELCAVLTAAGFPAHRNDQRFLGGFDNPDIGAEGLEGYHIEVKRVERLNVSDAFAQAVMDSAGKVPVVAHRKNREPWLITLKLEDWLNDHRKSDSDCGRGRREDGDADAPTGQRQRDQSSAGQAGG